MKKPSSRIRTWAPRVVVIGAIGLSLTSLYAFKALFPHSGEQAFNLVPVNALAVATLDLDPSPSQALVFKKIDDALARNGLADSVEGIAKKAMAEFPEQKGLWDLSKHSVTICMLESPDKKGEMDGAALFPLTDATQAEQILKAKGRSEFWKGTHYYRLPHSPVAMTLEGDTLVVGNTPWVFHEMADVASGQMQSINQAPGFAEARSKEPGDASLIVMVSPKLLEKSSQVKNLPSGWMSASLTVQDGGLALSGHGKNDPNANEMAATMASTKPLRADLFQVLPAGAYGVVALSQPANYFKAAEMGLKEADMGKAMKDGEGKMQKETGIDVESDILPAFQGDAVIAAYPSEAPATGVDFLLVVDNQNGANPDALAEKFQAYVDKQAASKDGPGKDWAVQVPRTDAAEFRLGPKVEKEMHDSMKGNSSDPVRYDVLTSHKTVAWAKVNGAVMLASSQEMLDKAIQSYQGKSAALASDSAMNAAAGSDSNQTLAILNFATIAQGVENTVDTSKMNAETRKQFKQILGLFENLTTPFSIKGSISTDGNSSGSLFIPLDYDKIIDLVGTMKNQSDKKVGAY